MTIHGHKNQLLCGQLFVLDNACFYDLITIKPDTQYSHCMLDWLPQQLSLGTNRSTIWLPRRREEYNIILPFAPVYHVQEREVWHECELASLYYTSTFKAEWNPFPDRRNVAVNDSEKLMA